MAMVKCPHCGEEFFVEDTKGAKKSRGLAIIAVAAVILLGAVAGVVFYLNNADPVKKYDRLIAQGKNAEAEALYNSKIATEEELEQQVLDREAEEIDGLLHAYMSREGEYDPTIAALNGYTEHEESKAKAAESIKEIEKHQKSREAYEQAVQKEKENDLSGAVAEYKKVIRDDDNYQTAQDKITELKQIQRTEEIKAAKELAEKGEYKKAIDSINSVIRTYGSDDELNQLLTEYNDRKDVMYAEIKVVEKTTTPKNINNWIFSNYVNFVFDITNNSDKAIKGIEGKLTTSDLFGKEILTMGCDFTGHTIEPGDTYTEKGLSYECNEYRDTDMKLYNTAYSDLIFHYSISSIVYADGTTVIPE